MSAWFESVKNPKLKSSKKVGNSNTPSGVWKKCAHCGEIIQHQRLENNHNVCPYCDHHFRLEAHKRLDLLVDEGSFKSFDQNLTTTDPLEFTDKRPYKVRLDEAFDKTGMQDGTLYGEATLDSHPVCLAIMNFQFMGGSMGVVTGEKIARVFDEAAKRKVPAIVVSCSGGARMQEGILSLMQMAKTCAAREILKRNSIPYFSILTDPTTGGVAASFSTLGDIIFAEPRALIGFAGPRVIEQSIRQKLPEGFQKSEFLLEHGLIDRIVHRHELKQNLSFFINMLHAH